MRRLAIVAAVAAGPLLAAAPASAHGIGARGDLPLPLWLVAYAAGGVLVVSFAALAWLWPRSRWEDGVAGRRLPEGLDRALRAMLRPARALGLLALAVVWGAAALGPPEPSGNLAPTIVYVIFWVGFIVASGLVGDLWRAVSPFETVAALMERAGPRLRPHRLGHWPGRRPAVGLHLARARPPLGGRAAGAGDGHRRVRRPQRRGDLDLGPGLGSRGRGLRGPLRGPGAHGGVPPG